MRTPKNERELVISGYTFREDGDRADSITIYTSDYSYMSKFDKFCGESPENWKLLEVLTQDGDVVGKRYSCPLACLSFRQKPLKRQYTAEQRQQMAAQLAKNLRQEHTA